MSHHLHQQHTDKELWWKAALQGVYFSQATINVTPAVLPLLTDNWVIPFHCMALLTTKWSLSLHAFIDNWMIPFTAWLYWQLSDPFHCIYHSRDTQSFSKGWTNLPPKLPLSVGDLDPHLLCESLGTQESAPKPTESELVKQFCSQ